MGFKKTFQLNISYIDNLNNLSNNKKCFKKNAFLLMSRNRETPLPICIKGGKK